MVKTNQTILLMMPTDASMKKVADAYSVIASEGGGEGRDVTVTKVDN